MVFDLYFQEDIDPDEQLPSQMNAPQSGRDGASGSSGAQLPATGVNPFTGAPVAAATEQTSLNTTEKPIYTSGI